MDDPHIPAAFNTANGLGALLGYYPARKANRWGNLAVCLLLLSGAVLVFLYGIYSSFLAYQLHGPAVIGDKITAPLLIAVLLSGLGLLAGWEAYVNWRKGVAVYERGFACRDRTGLQTWCWDDILAMTSAVTRHYHNGIYTGTTHVYTLLDRQNQRLKLGDSIGRVEDLAKAIDTNIFPRLYPRAVDQYNSGEMLPFGPIAISKQGMTLGKKTYPWGEVKEVSIHHGILRVTRKEGGRFNGARAAASAIPNLRVLLAIIQQVVGLKLG
jgi:hypothetical protein